MKKTVRPDQLPYLTMGLSGLGIVLRLWLYAGGTDEKGFLIPGYPAGILLWILTLVTAALLIWLTGPLKGQGRYAVNFPVSRLGAVGCWAMAAGIFFTALSDLMGGTGGISTITGILGVLCVPALIFAGYGRWIGARSSFLMYALPCVYFTARLIGQYRLWSADPQLEDYCFQLLACVGLMLVSYQRATFDVRMGRRRSYALLCLLTFYCCCLSVPYCEQKLFYICAALWLMTNLCSLKIFVRRAPKPAEQPVISPETPPEAPEQGPEPEKNWLEGL